MKKTILLVIVIFLLSQASVLANPMIDPSLIKRNDTNEVLYAIQNGADPNAYYPDGTTPIIYAIKHLQDASEMVRVLARNGADVNMCSFNGYTPLQHAALHKQVETFRALINFSSDINAQNDSGYTVLMLVANAPNEDAPLIEIVEILIANQAKVNISTSYGTTALRIARVCGNKKMYQLIRNAGGRE